MFIDKKKIAKKLKKEQDEIVVGFTASVFDLLHPGHLIMLQEAKDMCDYLIVGLLTNPKNDRPFKEEPVQTMFERYMQISACKYVDEVVPFESEEDLLNMIKVINPDIRFCGEEYRDVEHTGKGLGYIHYNRRPHDYSSSLYRKKLQKD